MRQKRPKYRKTKKGESNLESSDLERFAAILRSLANPTRLRLVGILADGERTVTELCEASGLKQALVSQQLKILRLSEIVRSRREGARTFYSLSERNVLRLIECLSRCRSHSA